MVHRVRSERDAPLLQLPHLAPGHALPPVEDLRPIADRRRGQKHGGGKPEPLKRRKGLLAEVPIAVVEGDDHRLFERAPARLQQPHCRCEASCSVAVLVQPPHLLHKLSRRRCGPIVRLQGRFILVGHAVVHEDWNSAVAPPGQHPEQRRGEVQRAGTIEPQTHGCVRQRGPPVRALLCMLQLRTARTSGRAAARPRLVKFSISSATRACCAAVSCGNMGSERILAATCVLTGSSSAL